MNRTTSLRETDLAHLLRFDHPGDVAHSDPEEEQSGDFSVNFTLAGSYELSIGKRSWLIAPGTVFVMRPGLRYRCRHVDEVPDDVCFSVAFKGDPTSGISEHVDSGQAVVPMNDRLAFLRWRMLAISEDDSPAMAVDHLAAELWDAAATPDPGRATREKQLVWYAERIEAARQALARDYAEPHTLASLSDAAGMSPFHFARVFRRLVGRPPHGYLLDARLTAARRRLEEGEAVTRTALGCGFGSPSHFSVAFKARFGVSPSAYARDPHRLN